MNYKSEACSCFVSYPKKFTTKRIILDSYEQIRLLDRIVLKHYFSSVQEVVTMDDLLGGESSILIYIEDVSEDDICDDFSCVCIDSESKRLI